MARSIKNLVGIKFGMLVVLCLDHQDIEKKTFWMCRCECGKEKVIKGANLVSGNTVSCGCYRERRLGESQFIDLRDSHFGKLLVLDRGENKILPSGQEQTMWNCICDCGNHLCVPAGELRNGKRISCQKCGNRRQGEKRLLDLVGKRFGKLVVLQLDRVDKRYGAYWKCKCDCGNRCVIVSGTLVSGDTKSCGCLSESLIASELKKYFMNKYGAKREYKIFKNPETNRWLPFDIYIPYGKNKKINGFYIEVQGYQHSKINGWHILRSKENGTTSEEEFEYQKKKDRMKRKFARKNGIYIEIDLRKIKTTDKAIQKIENKLKNLL